MTQFEFPSDIPANLCLKPMHPLRVYPMAFAERIRALFDQLVHKAEGKPAVPPGAWFDEGPLSFSEMPWSDWHEACLMGPLRYARGNNNLNRPSIWKDSFPKPFEILAGRDLGMR